MSPYKWTLEAKEKRLKEFMDALEEYSWIGSKHPDDMHSIRNEFYNTYNAVRIDLGLETLSWQEVFKEGPNARGR